MKPLSDIDAARIAVWVDSEGHITARANEKGDSKGRYYLRMSVGVTNTDRRVIDYLLEKCGIGSVTTRTRYPDRNHKTTYDFRLYNKQEIVDFLEPITDYMILKKQQALLVTKLAKSRIGSPWRNIKNGQFFSTSYTEEEKKMVDDIIALNKRGRGENKSPPHRSLGPVHAEIISSNVGTASKRRPHLV